MKIMIFDTETISYKKQYLVDISYRIVDFDTETKSVRPITEKGYIVSKLFNNIDLMECDAFSCNKVDKWKGLLAQKKMAKHTFQKIMEYIAKDISKYDIEFAYAYNSAFDTRIIKNECLRYGVPNPLEKVKVLDIWGYSSNLICLTEKYRKWANENGQFTETEKFIQTSVESVCKFLYNDLDFVEEHTALDDTIHELNILVECAKLGANITIPMKPTKFINRETDIVENITILSEKAKVELVGDNQYKITYTKETKRDNVRKLS